MRKSSLAASEPLIQHIERTRAMAVTEWETAQRILDIQNTGLRRIVELHSPRTRDPGDVSPDTQVGMAAPWINLYGKALMNTFEVAAISLDVFAAIEAELARGSRELFPLFKREMLEGVEQLNLALACVSSVIPTPRQEAA